MSVHIAGCNDTVRLCGLQSARQTDYLRLGLDPICRDVRSLTSRPNGTQVLLLLWMLQTLSPPLKVSLSSVLIRSRVVFWGQVQPSPLLLPLLLLVEIFFHKQRKLLSVNVQQGRRISELTEAAYSICLALVTFQTRRHRLFMKRIIFTSSQRRVCGQARANCLEHGRCFSFDGECCDYRSQPQNVNFGIIWSWKGSDDSDSRPSGLAGNIQMVLGSHQSM